MITSTRFVLILAIILGVLFLAVLAWALSEETTNPEIPGDGIVCTQDAKQCPDGSYVGRTGPNCEFAAYTGE